MPTTIVNFADISTPDWRFVADGFPDASARWRFHRNAPTNWLERRIRRPSLARIGAAWRAAADAKRADRPALISHLPRATRALAVAAAAQRVEAPHLAFSFNFTEPPRGRDLAAFRRALRGVDRFVVYSAFEQDLYPRMFDLDPARFDFLPWAMERPQLASPTEAAATRRPYVCAVGGEGRDYATLIEAFRATPSRRLVIVARPGSLPPGSAPANVEVRTNLSADRFWRVVADAEAMALPLRDARTACGHITLVGAYLLGTPVVATNSLGVADYIADDQALACPAGDAAALREAVESLLEDRSLRERLVCNAREFATHRCDPALWRDYVAGFVADTGVGTMRPGRAASAR